MSQRALALAVCDRLQMLFKWDTTTCDLVLPQGEPHPACGELFVGIWEGGYTNESLEARKDRHAINITISRRFPAAPQDRVSREVVHKISIGVEVIGDGIAAALHTDKDDYWVLNRANDYLEEAAAALIAAGVTVYGFAEPLRFLNATPCQTKSGRWFSADPAIEKAGVAMTMYFGKAYREQSILRQT